MYGAYKVETSCGSHSNEHGNDGKCVGPGKVVEIGVEHPIASPTLATENGHR